MYFTSFFLVLAFLQLWGSLIVYHEAAPVIPSLKIPLLLWCVIVPIAFAVGNIGIKRLPHGIVRLFAWIGGLWMGYVLYASISFLIVLVLFLGKVFFKIPDYTGAVVPWLLGLAGLATLIGLLEAVFPKIKRITVPTKKSLEKPLHILFISDIHTGAIWGQSYMKGLVNRANGLHPDLILLGGDLIDRDFGYPYKEGALSEFGKLKAPLGVYGVLGNHDLAAGARKELEIVFHDMGIPLLSNQTIEGKEFFLTALDDYIFGKRNYTIPEAKKETFSILLQHEPERIPEISQKGYDLSLAGHTHGGQLWPFSLLNDRIFYQNRGLKKVGSLISLVSSGYGGTSLPVRFGARSDMMYITVIPQKERSFS